MTSVFDGMGGVLNAVFGAPVNVTRAGQSAVAVQGVFRFVTIDDPTADGRGIYEQVPTLRLPINLMPALKRGDTVQPSAFPGRTFAVLQPDLNGMPAVDTMVTYVCEEI